jgi:hypothetical protein
MPKSFFKRKAVQVTLFLSLVLGVWGSRGLFRGQKNRGESEISRQSLLNLSFGSKSQVHLVKKDLLNRLKLWNHRVPKNFDFQAFTQSLLEAEIKYGIDYEILFAVAVIESGFHIQAESHKGAEGLFQFMPQTAELVWPRMKKTLAPRDPLHKLTPSEAVRDIRASTLMGAYYLRELQGLFSGQLHLALASYNVGPGALKKALGEGRLLSSEYVFRVYDLANEVKQRL